MGREPRSDYINRRAYELAVSGAHISAITIVSALVNEGYPEAADLLNTDLIRADLQRVCARHWKGVAVDASEPTAAVAFGPALPSRARSEHRRR